MSKMTIQRCEVCAREFVAKAAVVAEGGSRYCSPACWGVAKTARSKATEFASVERRFWARVVVPGPILVPRLGPCHTWSGATDGNGYGQIRTAITGVKRAEKAHRVAFFLHYGRWPAGHCLHLCDGGTIGCVRWEHLAEGTDADNQNDMIAKGRAKTKLTSGDVAAIRAELAAGATQASLARKFGVGTTQLNRIARGLSWFNPGKLATAPAE
jgi:hypothetical protein